MEQFTVYVNITQSGTGVSSTITFNPETVRLFFPNIAKGTGDCYRNNHVN